MTLPRLLRGIFFRKPLWIAKLWLYCKVFSGGYTAGTGFVRFLPANTAYMNKQDIAEKVHGVLGSTKADAERAVEAMIETIVGGLKGGDEVSVAGLGIFKTKMRAARTARNPRTGATVQVPSMRVPKFQPAKALKEAVK
jgi:DNA-binding protein HU-beta